MFESALTENAVRKNKRVSDDQRYHHLSHIQNNEVLFTFEDWKGFKRNVDGSVSDDMKQKREVKDDATKTRTHAMLGE